MLLSTSTLLRDTQRNTSLLRKIKGQDGGSVGPQIIQNTEFAILSTFFIP